MILKSALIFIFIFRSFGFNASEVNSALKTLYLPEIGHSIAFGGYEWKVLDIHDVYTLVISEDIIEIPYFVIPDAQMNLSWEVSFFREYLNGDFLNRFSEADMSRIRETKVINDINPWFDTCGGNYTVDRIFFLSIDEVVRYFGDSRQLDNRPTLMQYFRNGNWISRPPNKGEDREFARFIVDQYNPSRIAHYDNDKEHPSSFFDYPTPPGRYPFTWWLRTPGRFPHSFVVIHENGWVNMEGAGVTSCGVYIGIRPALWLRF